MSVPGFFPVGEKPHFHVKEKEKSKVLLKNRLLFRKPKSCDYFLLVKSIILILVNINWVIEHFQWSMLQV